MYDTLLLCAGGGLGWTYIGAYQALLEKNLIKDLKTIAGISIGSIIGLLLQLNYTVDALKELILNIDLPSLENCKDISYFIDNFGLDNGDKVVIVLKTIIQEKFNKDDITFKELHEITGIEFIVQATNLNKYCLETFSYKTKPDMSISTAIRMSITIPFYYTPIKWDNDYYVDGGVLTSVPYIEELKNNKNVLTLHVKRIIKPENNYDSFIDYMFDVWLCFMHNRIEKQLNVDTIEFCHENYTILPKKEEIITVMNYGYNCTLEWISLRRNDDLVSD